MAIKKLNGHKAVMPYMILKDLKSFIQFAENIFACTKRFEVPREDTGLIMHAEMDLDDSTIMLADATDEYPVCNAMLFIYVEDVDATYKKAIEAGASSIREPFDESYGARSAGIKDAWGNSWWLGAAK